MTRQEAITLVQAQAKLPTMISALALTTLYQTSDADFSAKFPFAMRVLRHIVNGETENAKAMLGEFGINPALLGMIAPMAGKLSSAQKQQALDLIATFEHDTNPV